MPIIEVEHLTKEYKLGTLTSIEDNAANTPWPSSCSEHRDASSPIFKR